MTRLSAEACQAVVRRPCLKIYFFMFASQFYLFNLALTTSEVDYMAKPDHLHVSQLFITVVCKHSRLAENYFNPFFFFQVYAGTCRFAFTDTVDWLLVFAGEPSLDDEKGK